MWTVRSGLSLFDHLKSVFLSITILLASQGVSFTEVQEGLIVRREVHALRRLVALLKVLSPLLGFCPRYSELAFMT